MTTNYEKIKAMSIDEMEEILTGDCENYCDAKNCEGNCIENVKHWLKREQE